MSDYYIRKHIRQFLIELDSSDLEFSSQQTEPVEMKTLTDTFVKNVIDPITGDYRTNPVVRRETDAILNATDNWATAATVGLAALGIGAAVIGAPAAAPILGGAALIGILNNSTQATAALVRGDKTAAATHVLLAALDAAIGGQSEALTVGIGRRVASDAARRTAAAKSSVAARNLGYAAGQVAPATKTQVALVRRAARPVSQAAKEAGAMGGFLAGGASVGSLEIIGNELVNKAQEYDDARRAQGLPHDSALTQPARDMAARLKSGNPTPDDASKVTDALVRMKILDSKDEQSVYEALLDKSLGIEQSDNF